MQSVDTLNTFQLTRKEYFVIIECFQLREVKTMMKECPAGSGEGIQARLIALYDEIGEFHDQCSFLCDAFASIVRQQDVIDPETVRGVSIYSQSIKEQAGQIRSELKKSLRVLGASMDGVKEAD
jgi:hypothetical protein